LAAHFTLEGRRRRRRRKRTEIVGISRVGRKRVKISVLYILILTCKN
jgi:hypothetical protein